MSRSAKILKLVQPALPGAVLCRDVLVLAPTGYLLRGFFLNATSQKHHMDLWKVVMPLHRPFDTLVLTYGTIIAGPDDHRVKVDDVERAAEVVKQCLRHEVQALRDLEGPPQFLQRISRMSDSEFELVQLDFALTHFLIGNVSEARRILRSQMERPEIYPTHRQVTRWAFDALEAGPEALQSLIDGWRDDNIARFGLEPTSRRPSGVRLVGPT
ncbi:hypothetical protein DNX69_24120 [Rhodopseudomonas palustris]|uniref:Uncharacterized protein n=1 Tax=Rhodopseudomonas palustris TaxID=1076 RepID=A0A323UAG7_RHOPL|nr:hypothetical protein [Rhodopseudomonas palustris]PZA09197.1 hypothetical protein DNX69_24120 [Rhodopseudomonas palustris]